MIKKFQSPSGSIEYQQAHGGAFSINDPYTAGYDEGDELYDLTHSAPYQLTNAGCAIYLWYCRYSGFSNEFCGYCF